MAGDLARGGASHAIADDEGALLRARTTGVLIGAADAATMGEHGEEADAVVKYRERHGNFRAWGDLLIIYGVDGKKIAAAKDKISF